MERKETILANLAFLDPIGLIFLYFGFFWVKVLVEKINSLDFDRLKTGRPGVGKRSRKQTFSMFSLAFLRTSMYTHTHIAFFLNQTC